MTLMVLDFAAIGALLLALVLLIRPRRVELSVAIGRFDAARRGDPAGGWPAVAGVFGDGGTARSGMTAVRDRLGRRLAVALSRRGIALSSQRQDLALLGRSYEAFLATKVLVGLYGGLLVAAVAVGLSAAGVGVPAVVAAGLMLAVAAGFSFLPDLGLRSQAAVRRRDFRRVLGSFLDLVALSMAGGRGLPEALPAAARIGTGWAFELLRATLERARDVGQPAWEALGELGERTGVEDLRSLAGSLLLVASDGARIRDTLSARATTLRRRQLTDAEGEANERDQAMRVAQLLIGFGFVIFIGYPAVANVLAV